MSIDIEVYTRFKIGVTFLSSQFYLSKFQTQYTELRDYRLLIPDQNVFILLNISNT